VIPTRARAEAVRCLLGALSRQELAPNIEIEAVVAFDGDEPSLGVQEAATGAGFPVHLLGLPRVGISEAKNLAVNQATGDILLFINDDMEPAETFVKEHVRAGRGCSFEHTVLGRTDWKVYPNDTVMDRLVRSTSMIYFYDKMTPGKLYGFRHAWNLNLSMSRDAFEEVGGFRCELRPCMFEDLELAWRMERKGRRVLYHDRAQAVHHHRYSWDGYLRREVVLGLMAPVLGRVNQECFRAIWDRSPEDLREECRRWLDMDRGDQRRIQDALVPMLRLPGDVVPANPTCTAALYGMHLPLKRRAFRAGFVAGMEEIDRVPWTKRPEHAGEIYYSQFRDPAGAAEASCTYPAVTPPASHSSPAVRHVPLVPSRTPKERPDDPLA